MAGRKHPIDEHYFTSYWRCKIYDLIDITLSSMMIDERMIMANYVWNLEQDIRRLVSDKNVWKR